MQIGVNQGFTIRGATNVSSASNNYNGGTIDFWGFVVPRDGYYKVSWNVHVFAFGTNANNFKVWAMRYSAKSGVGGTIPGTWNAAANNADLNTTGATKTTIGQAYHHANPEDHAMNLCGDTIVILVDVQTRAVVCRAAEYPVAIGRQLELPFPLDTKVVLRPGWVRN